MGAINKLSARQVETFNKPGGKLGDGGGLWLVCRREGERTWQFRYVIDGREQQIGLGPVRDVSLAGARALAQGWRQCLIEGKNPKQVRDGMVAARKVETLRTITFRDAVHRFLATDKVEQFKNPKHRAQWRSTLEGVFPVLGDLPLQQIDAAAVLAALEPIWKRTPETGSRLRSRIERVFSWAAPLGLHTGDNPASLDLLKDHLPAKRKVEHHSAMPWAELPSFMAKLRERESVSARALEFAVLTAARTSEVIGATWNEIDLDAKVWTISGDRMKAGKEHRVPLSDRAVAILKVVSRDTTGEHVFANGSGRALSNMALLEMVRGVAGNGYTTHGFRSSFRDWCGERTNYPKDVIEFALAHKLPDKVEQAYRRETAVEKRRQLMTQWARYCETDGSAGTVHNLRSLRAV